MNKPPARFPAAISTGMCVKIPGGATTTLSKRMFFSMPTGGLLVSNCLHSPTRSIFEEIVEPAGLARERQWQRIVLAGASQRLCRVFRSRKDYQRWLASFT